ncbi:DUF6090 family protein [Confluentibacter lentus]|uniref:DUF6090 family protein n=1 Tax=Confluentibacter lentus TaxID=1699412 RepID=UPI001E5CE242|nr:DUF6090 family protein [Confluentibacter lentus]
MIRFFKNIRRNLISKGKIVQYLKYAFGEIVLVVIGILIALQINNWNQNRINDKNERIYLLGLKEEFQISKFKLEELIAVNQKNYNGAKNILTYHNSKQERPTESTFSKVLYQTFSDDIAFNPNNSLLHEMINSGNLKNLTNNRLRTQLTNWVSTLEDISKQEEELGDQRIKVLDMFRTNQHSLSTIFKQAGLYKDLGLVVSENEISNLALLDSTGFENNMLMFLLASYATEQAHYQPLMGDLDAILMQIDKGLQ